MTLPNKKIILSANLILLTSLVVANIYFSSSFATSGQKLKQLEQEIDAIEEQNQDLKRNILQKSSLHVLESKAEQLGFTKPNQYITVEGPSTSVALSQ